MNVDELKNGSLDKLEATVRNGRRLNAVGRNLDVS